MTHPSRRRHPVVAAVAVLALGTALLTAGLVTGLAAAVGALPGRLIPTTAALGDIPPDMLTRYQAAAARCPGLPWTVLAAIGKTETDHGRRVAVSTAGALGPMQFMPATWAAYGVDADPDGRIDVMDPDDATAAASDYLCAHGAPDDLPAAVYSYNHSTRYVAGVLALADSYGATLPPADTQVAHTAVTWALAQLGTPYRWGGEGPGGFDCSGLVQAAYAAAGLTLPRTAQTQFDAGPRLPLATALQPGDLVFYGTGPDRITHVGMVISERLMVDAPHSGAVVRTEPWARPSLIGATRPTLGALPVPLASGPS